jgi:hypothetical protein
LKKKKDFNHLRLGKANAAESLAQKSMSKDCLSHDMFAVHTYIVREANFYIIES